MGTVTLLRRGRSGTRRGPRGRAPNQVGYNEINDSAADAYFNQTGKHSAINGRTTLKHLLARLEEYLVFLGDPYQVPGTTDDNDALLTYLWRVSRFFETTTNANYPGDPDRRIVDVMENGNHKSCIVLLDSILQGIFASKTKLFLPGDRPPFTGGTETSYFVEYVDAIGNA